MQFEYSYRLLAKVHVSFIRPPLIDPRHDLLGPLDGVRGRRNSRPRPRTAPAFWPRGSPQRLYERRKIRETLCFGKRKLGQSDDECNRDFATTDYSCIKSWRVNRGCTRASLDTPGGSEQHVA